MICSLLSADMMFMFGVTTLDGEEDAELLEEILTGVVEPDTGVGDFNPEDVLEKPLENPSDRQDAHFQPVPMSLSLITGLWQSWKAKRTDRSF